MPQKPTNSEDTTKDAESLLESASEAIGGNADPLFSFLNLRDLANFAEASIATLEMTAAAIKKRALEKLLSPVTSLDVKLINKIVIPYPEFLLDPSVPLSVMAFCTKDLIDKIAQSKPELLNSPYLLLSAVVSGNEYFARKIVEAHPALLLDTSAKVTDISGKEITGLTPVQAAMCAGDVVMVQMMKEVVPELDIHSQFMAISQNRDIDAVEAEQKSKAQEFKDSKLRDILAVINAATSEQIEFELNTLGQLNTDSPLNATLRNFREQFDTRASGEQIFNPFDLLSVFEFYEEQFYNFNGNEDDEWKRRDLFWCQVIGYMQRHLPACYLQAFAQGIYYITENNEELKRDFELRNDKGFYMVPRRCYLKNLGYKAWVGGGGGLMMHDARYVLALAFQKLLQTKNQGWRTYLHAAPPRTSHEGRVRNSVRL